MASQLSKSFGSLVAVSDVTFAVQPGVTALLGPNGAGKSTLIRLLCGLTPPSTGSVWVAGGDPRTDQRARANIGLVPQQDGVFERERGIDVVTLAAVLSGLDRPEVRAAEALAIVELDPELAPALLDLKQAGKHLLLITNSEWWYTKAMMSYVLDRYLPGKTTWRDLFHLVIASARKPDFFSQEGPIFEVVDDQVMPQPHRTELRPGGVYLGGGASFVERSLNLLGEQILYIGDHIAADVRASKDLLRWRTALVLRDLEQEIECLEAFSARQAELSRLMAEKGELEQRQAWLRLQLQRLESKYGPQPSQSPRELRTALLELRSELEKLDSRIAPLAREAGEIHKPRWGPLLRAGNDNSHLARQIERSADVYTSRVSNLLCHTPFAYLRAAGSSLPHEAHLPSHSVDPSSLRWDG